MPSSVSKDELLSEIGVDHATIFGDGLRRALGDLLPVVEDHDALSQPHHGRHDVLDDDESEPLRVKSADEGDHLAQLRGVEARHHLVEGTPQSIAEDRRVVDAYLGEEFVLADA